MTLLALRTGRLAVDLAPASGGSIARFTVDGSVDVLRPATDQALASQRGNDAACYPLVPYSNRIAEGRLSFQGENIRLQPNWPGQRHPMHGDGWSAAWSVVRSDSRSAEIMFLHEPARTHGGWPFRYRARQTYALDEERLSVRLEIENLEDRSVPAGIGLHPFFTREADTQLACRCATVWRADAEILPVDRITVPAEWNFAEGRKVDDVALDNCFDGWDGRATVTWPSRRLGLTLEAGAPFGHLVIYTPPGRPYFCVEPVSHANGQVGHAALAAGAKRAGTVQFRLSRL